jgi:predicted MFS family arabinose efflux permease
MAFRSQPHPTHEAENEPTPVWVVLGLALGPLVALGLSRFAYALLLPAMQSDLSWSYAQAGSLNTVNAAGYLVGALVAARAGREFGDKTIFVAGLALTSLATAFLGAFSRLEIMLVLRLVAGFAGAVSFVSGAGLTSAAAHGGPTSRAPTLLGIYFAGAGLGIAVSAVLVPVIAVHSWRIGWVILGGMAFMATLGAASVMKRAPEPAHVIRDSQAKWSPLSMKYELAAYCCFGAGYIAYATFIIAYLRNSVGFDSQSVSVFWIVLGLSAVFAAFGWGPVLARLKGGQGAAVTIGTVTIGAALPLVWQSSAAAYVSAVLFGGSFLAVIAAVTSFARRTFHPHNWTQAIGLLTISFGLGQSVGPLFSGMLSDGVNGISSGLWISVGVLAAATATAALQSEHAPDRP